MSTVENFQFFQTGCVVFILSHMEAKICMEKKNEKKRTRRKLKYVWKKKNKKEPKICMEKKRKKRRKLKYVWKKREKKKEAKICMEKKKKKRKKEAKICMGGKKKNKKEAKISMEKKKKEHGS